LNNTEAIKGGGGRGIFRGTSGAAKLEGGKVTLKEFRERV